MGKPECDVELWTFIDKVHGRNLRNIADTELQVRLDRIDRNIQLLDNGPTPRDRLPAQHGWLSPWWWLRARHWTLLEFEHRRLMHAPTPSLPPIPALAAEFLGLIAGSGDLLVRISRATWLLDFVRDGHLRFTPAASYDDATLDEARADDEMRKSRRRPGQVLTMTGPRGPIVPIGDVEFATGRHVERNGTLHPVPYWFMSFSSDLDPRLFVEFPDSDGAEQACVVIFDTPRFLQRALPYLNRAAPHAMKKLFPNDYFDPYFIGDARLQPLVSKDMRYAFQRERRFALDPEGGPPLAGGGVLEVDIGAITDIAAVYSPNGRKILGSGPESFLV